MSEESSGGAGVNAVAMVVIVLILVGAVLFVLQSGMLGGGGSGKNIDVNIKTPTISAPAK